MRARCGATFCDRTTERRNNPWYRSVTWSMLLTGNTRSQGRITPARTRLRTEMVTPPNILPPRQRILAAADDLFRRQGIRGVGVEAIAEAAETNKKTLYRHFPSKDE